MIEVTISWDNISVTIKNEEAENIQDCVELLQEALNYHNDDIQLSWCEFEESEDDAIYIQQDQPQDHIQHEGM